MGYRSNLHVKCKTESLHKLYPVISEHDFEDCITDVEIDDDYTYFTMYDLKWYDSYPDVTAFNTVIEENPTEMCMLCEGEELGDIEAYGDLEALDFYWNVVIDFDGFVSGSQTLEDITKQVAKTHPEYVI